MTDEQSADAWLREQVAKVPHAELLGSEGPAEVWVLRYAPTGWLPFDWWLRPGSRAKHAEAMTQFPRRPLSAEQHRQLAALSLAVATWLDHQPSPPTR